MSTTIPLASLSSDDGWRRDQWGRYLIVPPGGGDPVGYTRVTTVAKTLDDGGGLAPWKATLAVCGSIMRRNLRAQWEVLMAEYGSDPWYAGEPAKQACKALVEECAKVGGSTDRRDTGTALHRLTALHDLGQPLKHLTAETEADLDAYVTGLAEAGIKVVPEYIEQTVVLDGCSVAGTFDRLVTVPGYELPVVADLKTGADLSYSWQSISIQLAAYAMADAIYRQGAAPDGSLDERSPMPRVDQRHGLVMWMAAGSAELSLQMVDLESGREGFDLSMAARSWRRQDVRRSFDDLSVKLEASLAAAQIDVDQERATIRLVSSEEPPTVEPSEDNTTLLRRWLQGRIDIIGTHELARSDLGMSWPEGVPTLKASTGHSPEELDRIERVLDEVERRHGIKFPPPKPGPAPDPVELVLAQFPTAVITTEQRTTEP